MSDQAEKLRRLSEAVIVEPRADQVQLPMVVVAGARSGVGATTVAVNMAAAIADRGDRVLLVDAAEDGSDLADLAGVSRELQHSTADAMHAKCTVADAIVEGPVGMRVLANRRCGFGKRGSASRRGATTCSREGQQKLLDEIDSLRDEIDLVIVDAGSGLTAWTRRLWLRAQCVVLVTTADDASVMDAYSAMKLSTADGIRSSVRLLVNREINEAAGEDAQRRLQKACQKFLSLSIAALPALPMHEGDFGAGALGGPRVWESPNSVFGRATLWLGRAVTDALAEGRETCGRADVRGRETRAQQKDAVAEGRETCGRAVVRGRETRAQHGAETRAQHGVRGRETRAEQLSSNPIELFMKATEQTLN
jgi:flagellar biosynthesis protein FlhG